MDSTKDSPIVFFPFNIKGGIQFGIADHFSKPHLLQCLSFLIPAY